MNNKETKSDDNFKLTTKEAIELIDMLKRKVIETDLVFPGKGQKIEFDVYAEKQRTRFVVNIYRSGKNDKKCTYQGRTYLNSTPILRLDITDSTHINSDGTKINESDVLREESIKLNAQVTNMSDLSSVTAITVLDPSGNEIEDGITVDLANGTVEATVAQDGTYTLNVTALNDRGTSVTRKSRSQSF